jgi:putative alpha-1,2-mannosidase
VCSSDLLLSPHISDDVDRAYYGADHKLHHAYGWEKYGTFSLEATHLVVYPLYHYICPKRINDIAMSLLTYYRETGHLPVWGLAGKDRDAYVSYHSAAIIADTYLKSPGNFNPEYALQACVNTAKLDSLDMRRYCLPAARLQTGYDDYGIARMAEKQGYKELAAEFDRRAERRQEFLPMGHEIEKGVKLMGGVVPFGKALDSIFIPLPVDKGSVNADSTGVIGRYVHGNLTNQHIAYLYNAARQPWKTQRYVRYIMHKLYLNAPAGLCDTSDFEQLSAWYVFSAMGFYPVDPISGMYEIGSPLYSKMQIMLPNDKKFTVLAHHVSNDNIYIQSVKLNGKPYRHSYITHQQIMEGCTLELEMGNAPGKVWY